MRILILTNDGEGIYKFRREVVSKLIETNDVFVSLPKDNYIEKLEQMGCHYIETEFNRRGINPLADLKQVFTYIKMIKEVKPDVILTYTIKPNVYGGIAAQITHVPYMANITGGVGSSPDNNKIIILIATILYKIGLKKCKMVFFQNNDNKEFMLKKDVISGDYRVIPGSGVNLNQYKVLDYPNDETIDFAYIGRIMTKKGFRQYLDAAKEIYTKHPNTRFHVCGIFEDDYKDEVDKLVNDGTIIYHGSVVNMEDIYKIIQCTIHPTFYPEGLSNVLLESCASGRAIITTDRPGTREVINDGINGFICKQKDSDDLINQIEKFLSLSNEERKQMGLNGRAKVEKEFNREIVIQAYLEEINKLV